MHFRLSGVHVNQLVPLLLTLDITARHAKTLMTARNTFPKGNGSIGESLEASKGSDHSLWFCAMKLREYLNYLCNSVRTVELYEVNEISRCFL